MNDKWDKETRSERRERKKQAERARIPKHSRRIAELYQQAVLKRLRELDRKPES